MQGKICCSQCGYENRSDYSFCGNCGAPLVKPVREAGPCSENSNISYSAPEPIPSAAIGNMPLDAARDFIGNNHSTFIPKFMNFQTKGTSTSWNWPVALFSFLLGMPFVWFFYRKMYRVGAVILAISTALIIINSICATTIIKASVDLVLPYMEQIISNPTGQISEELYQQLINDAANLGPGPSIASMVSNLVSILTLAFNIIVTVAANGLYMKHMLNTFNKAAQTCPEGVTSSELQRLGGTCLSLAVFIDLCYVVASVIISVIPVGRVLVDYINKIIELVI